MRVKIDYIYHSSFVINTENNLLIFDYYKSDTEKTKIIMNLLNEAMARGKKVLVFSSHSHYDHFNKEIFKWKDLNPNINYILSSDIKVSDKSNYNIISQGEQITIKDINISAYGSTDAGVSYVVEVDGIKMVHAGDLNWWYWKDEDTEEEARDMENAFKAIVEDISKHGKLDLAFFPVDPRLQEFYYLGGEYFIEKTSPRVFIPMHFGEDFDVTKKFKENIKREGTQVIEIDVENQSYELDF